MKNNIKELIANRMRKIEELQRQKELAEKKKKNLEDHIARIEKSINDSIAEIEKIGKAKSVNGTKKTEQEIAIQNSKLEQEKQEYISQRLNTTGKSETNSPLGILLKAARASDISSN